MKNRSRGHIIFPAIILLALACLGLSACGGSGSPGGSGNASGETEAAPRTAWLAADTDTVDLYDLCDVEETQANGRTTASEQMLPVLSAPRGSEVTFTDEDFDHPVSWVLPGSGAEEAAAEEDAEAAEGAAAEAAPTDLVRVTYDGGEYFVPTAALAENERDAVREAERFVRTSVTVYENNEDARIASWLRKGTALTIEDYDYLLPDGSVNMYLVSAEGIPADGSSETPVPITGWVFGKYLAPTEEAALAVNTEYADIHADRAFRFELYGGVAGELDYWPVEKPSFEDNPLLEEARTLYVNVGEVWNMDRYIDIALSSGINALVIDIKDGVLAYHSEVAEELCPSANNRTLNEVADYQAAVQRARDAGLYVIGRIVVFNDSWFAEDHPECTIMWGGSTGWPSAFCREAWYYNVRLAQEAIDTMGFNEIQFDYVRFPEASYQMSKDNADFHNLYDEEKAEAIQSFLYYAADMLHREGVYLSVDVFGECSSDYVTAYGQYYPAISNIVDVISSMPYSDHWGREIDTWSEPYGQLYEWARNTYARRNECPTPAVDRTWITAYDTPHWDPVVDYDAEIVASEISALYDAGLTGGFITWNGRSNVDKYLEIMDAFGRDYAGGGGSAAGSAETEGAADAETAAGAETTAGAETGAAETAAPADDAAAGGSPAAETVTGQ